jgi:SAM-dependent methyltransferase
MFDVLEHVDADGAALESLSSLLAPGGVLLLTVPAHPWLWSRHDEFLHHRRRYTRRALEEVLQASGLNVVSLGYFNTLLFPLALIGRLTDQLMGRRLPVGSRIPTAVLNAALTRIFAFERLVVPSYFLPFGLSLIAVAGREREA